jgi:hypothetical protein
LNPVNLNEVDDESFSLGDTSSEDEEIEEDSMKKSLDNE